MTASSEWQVGEQPSNATEESQVAPASDLFDGELLPEELIAIYNETVGEGTAPEGHPSEEIPTLPPQSDKTAPEVTSNSEKAVDSTHPGARVAETAARLDGMGVFESSSSYNDLTTLLTPSGKPSCESANKEQSQPGKVPGTAGQTIQDISAKTPLPAASIPVTTHPAVAANTGSKRKAVMALEPSKAKKPVAGAGPALTNPGVRATPTVVSAASKPPTVQASHNTLTRAVPAPLTATTSTPSAPNPTPVSSNPAVAPKKPATGSSRSTHKKTSATVPETAVSAPKAQPPKAATEADFKTVAQAAVSSLILSTKNGEVPSGESETGGQGINTTTAHIKALTGSNWVAACSGTGAAAVTAGGSPATVAADAKANNRSKRQNLTADERARQNRDRNREHARNTRLRKKAYVEELKRTLTELVAQRDKSELDKRQAAQREVEQREVRFRVIEEFLKLRGRNETNYASWAAILDSNFSLTLPATDFRAMVDGGTAAEANCGPCMKLEKIFSGVHEAMNEANSFTLFLQSLGGKSEASQCAPVAFVYNCDRNNFFMDDSHAVLDWGAATVGVTKRGSQNELSVRGSIRASFCPASNKLLSANIMFDTGAVLSQLQEFMSIPKTAYEAEAQAASNRADAILDSLQMPQLDTPTIVPQGESSDEGP